MNIVKENDGTAMVEISGRYHVVEFDRVAHQVHSILPSDAPAGGGQWYAALTDRGVQYVSRGRTRSAAISAFNRVIRVRGDRRTRNRRRDVMWYDRDRT